MITKREWYLISTIGLILIILMGGVFNFLAIISNGGKMPILNNNPYLQEFETNNYFIINSCENINYCFAVDKYGGEFYGYLIKASIGDFIILLGWIGSNFCLIKWLSLVSKDEKNEN